MSKTTKTAAATSTVMPSTITVETINPATTMLDPNIRATPTLSAEFVGSIRGGVREPVLARRDTDGTVYVYDGQRRLLAAQEVGLPGMLAIFGLAGESMDTAGRVLEQLATFNRAELGELDRLAAYEQLALDGVSVDTIARRAGSKKDTVSAALTVAKSVAAKEALSDGALTLDEAIFVAEFDGDDEAVTRLREAAGYGDDLAFTAQSIRDEYTLTAHRAAVVAEYEASGMAVFTSYESGAFAELYQLTDAAAGDPERRMIDAETHAGCPGHGVYIRIWGTKDTDMQKTFVCTRPELHHSRYTHNQPKPSKENQTPEEAEAATKERRRVIANNKIWDTAETVRRAFITEKLLTRKTLPKDATAYVAHTLTEHRNTVVNDHSGLVAGFLGGEDHGRQYAASIVTNTPTKAAHVSLAVALSAREANTGRQSWRRVNEADRDHLLQLEKWGYTLSSAERLAAGYPETETEEITGTD